MDVNKTNVEIEKKLRVIPKCTKEELNIEVPIKQQPPPQQPQQDQLSVTDDLIKQYGANEEIIKYVKSKFKKLSRVGAIRTIRLILRNTLHIKDTMLSPKFKDFARYNPSMFDGHELKQNVVVDLNRSIKGLLVELNKDVPRFDEEKHKFLKIKNVDGVDNYVIDKSVGYEKFRILINPIYH